MILSPANHISDWTQCALFMTPFETNFKLFTTIVLYGNQQQKYVNIANFENHDEYDSLLRKVIKSFFISLFVFDSLYLFLVNTEMRGMCYVEISSFPSERIYNKWYIV